jgi:hypothetical protein
VATATPSPPLQHTSSRKPLLLSPLALWHLLSLDAPTVAVLWTWFIARANHIHLPIAATLAMGIAVWMLYAADRLLDAQSAQQDTLEARHLFHHRHRTAFLTGILVASAALAFLLPRLDTQSIHLYLILGGLVFGYFILIHVTHSAAAHQKVAHRLPKEIAVGIFFAAAIFIPTVARQPHLRLALLPPALLFATLCSLNCLFIYAWEHTRAYTEHTAHTTTRLALRHLPFIAICITLASIALALTDSSIPWPIPIATTIAAMLLLTLHQRNHHIQPTILRAAADMVLLTPILFLPFLR